MRDAFKIRTTDTVGRIGELTILRGGAGERDA
jgi:hypothetical protein